MIWPATTRHASHRTSWLRMRCSPPQLSRTDLLLEFNSTQTSSIHQSAGITARPNHLDTPELVLRTQSNSGSVCAAANAFIDEAASVHLLLTVDIAEVDHDRSSHFPFETTQVKRPELRPLRHDDHDI